jgi:hypothetical protein
MFERSIVMENRIRELKVSLQYAIEAGDTRSLRRTLPEEFKQITTTLSAFVHGEDSIPQLKGYLEEIDSLAILRRMNPIFEAMTRGSYLNLTQSYHLSLYFASLEEVVRKNRTPKYVGVDSIMQDIDFLLTEGKKILPRSLHKLLKKKAEDAKQKVKDRLSSVDRLLDRFFK